jgi:hypothetical protein
MATRPVGSRAPPRPVHRPRTRSPRRFRSFVLRPRPATLRFISARGSEGPSRVRGIEPVWRRLDQQDQRPEKHGRESPA